MVLGSLPPSTSNPWNQIELTSFDGFLFDQRTPKANASHILSHLWVPSPLATSTSFEAANDSANEGEMPLKQNNRQCAVKAVCISAAGAPPILSKYNQKHTLQYHTVHLQGKQKEQHKIHYLQARNSIRNQIFRAALWTKQFSLCCLSEAEVGPKSDWS